MKVTIDEREIHAGKLPLRKELFLYYHGIGDSLLFNTVLFHLGRQTGERFMVGSRHPAIYQGNPYVRHLPFGQKINYKLAKVLSGIGWVKAVRHIDYYQEGRVPQKHILQLLSERVGLKEVPPRPVIFLSDEERAQKILPESSKPRIALQSTGNSLWTDNKNWGADRFLELAGMISGSFSLVQVGAAGDPPLPVELNLAGKLSLRQTLRVLGECSGFVGQEGFLMHAAAAMSAPSVIVYGGFLAPWQTGYPFNVNLYNPVPCAPCWLETLCPYQKKCMTEIHPDQVAAELERLLKA
jgi:ADP-heptose:LPS heptosyltransferase